MAGARREGQLRSRSRDGTDEGTMSEAKQPLVGQELVKGESRIEGKPAGGHLALICFLGIFVSYFIYGLLQEKM